MAEYEQMMKTNLCRRLERHTVQVGESSTKEVFFCLIVYTPLNTSITYHFSLSLIDLCLSLSVCPLSLSLSLSIYIYIYIYIYTQSLNLSMYVHKLVLFFF